MTMVIRELACRMVDTSTKTKFTQTIDLHMGVTYDEESEMVHSLN